MVARALELLDNFFELLHIFYGEIRSSIWHPTVPQIVGLIVILQNPDHTQPSSATDIHSGNVTDKNHFFGSAG